MEKENLSTKEIIAKYSKKLESEFNSEIESSADYSQFKRDMLKELSEYERWAKTLGNLIKIKVAEKDRVKIEKHLKTARLEVTPSQSLTLSVIAFLGLFFITLLIGTSIYLITESFPTLLVFLGIITSFFVFYYAYTMPKRLANIWRLKASSEMVPAILYIVVYMKHTSNLERAVAFAAEHLEGPLGLDFKKIFYDVEIGKYSTIKQSLDNYLESWREYSPEFVESFHLIESSLFEPTEARRVQILEKSLQIILDGVYEKMLRYSREIRSPLTNIYMLGIILPTLGLALLPLASTLLGGAITWPILIVIFNIIIPFLVFYLVSEALIKRPGGYGESSVLELNPQYYKYESRKPWLIASLIAVPILLLGLLPLILQLGFISSLGLPSDFALEKIGLSFLGEGNLFNFRISDGERIGPFGTGAIIFSLLIPLAIGMFFSSAYKRKTKDLIKSRDDTKYLEKEFTNSLFQLGNRIGDGVPVEIAFGKVAQSTQGQKTQEFFSLVNRNFQQSGMSLESAIFDKKRGALTLFPSSLIATSMRILLESAKKGLQVAARSLMSISEYVKNIDKINERLHDLLAEIVSDMKSNMTFLAPLLAGIIVGLSSMITSILNKLHEIQISAGASTDSIGGFGSLNSITSIFEVNQMIPPYFIQISIGIYIIEIIFILTSALVTVDSGRDPLKEKNELSKNLIRGLSLYLIAAFLSILILNILATISLGSLS